LKVPLTFDVKHDDFTFDRISIDGAPVLPLVLPLYVSYLEVPLLHERSDDGEPGVVDDPPVLVRQGDGIVIQPGNLISNTYFNDVI